MYILKESERWQNNEEKGEDEGDSGKKIYRTYQEFVKWLGVVRIFI